MDLQTILKLLSVQPEPVVDYIPPRPGSSVFNAAQQNVLTPGELARGSIPLEQRLANLREMQGFQRVGSRLEGPQRMPKQFRVQPPVTPPSYPGQTQAMVPYQGGGAMVPYQSPMIQEIMRRSMATGPTGLRQLLGGPAGLAFSLAQKLKQSPEVVEFDRQGQALIQKKLDSLRGLRGIPIQDILDQSRAGAMSKRSGQKSDVLTDTQILDKLIEAGRVTLEDSTLPPRPIPNQTEPQMPPGIGAGVSGGEREQQGSVDLPPFLQMLGLAEISKEQRQQQETQGKGQGTSLQGGANSDFSRDAVLIDMAAGRFAKKDSEIELYRRRGAEKLLARGHDPVEVSKWLKTGMVPDVERSEEAKKDAKWMFDQQAIERRFQEGGDRADQRLYKELMIRDVLSQNADARSLWTLNQRLAMPLMTSYKKAGEEPEIVNQKNRDSYETIIIMPDEKGQPVEYGYKKRWFGHTRSGGARVLDIMPPVSPSVSLTGSTLRFDVDSGKVVDAATGRPVGAQ